MVKIVKNPGNGRLNNLNDPVLNVLSWLTESVEISPSVTESESVQRSAILHMTIPVGA